MAGCKTLLLTLEVEFGLPDLEGRAQIFRINARCPLWAFVDDTSFLPVYRMKI